MHLPAPRAIPASSPEPATVDVCGRHVELKLLLRLLLLLLLLILTAILSIVITTVITVFSGSRADLLRVVLTPLKDDANLPEAERRA